MRPLVCRVVLSIAVLALVACSSNRAAPPTSVDTASAAAGSAEASRVIAGLQHAGLPVVSPVPQVLDVEEPDGLQARVDFRDARLLSPSSSSDSDTAASGGSVEAFDNELDAVAASKDRGGYVFTHGRVVVLLSSDLAPEWVIDYRAALDALD